MKTKNVQNASQRTAMTVRMFLTFINCWRVQVSESQIFFFIRPSLLYSSSALAANSPEVRPPWAEQTWRPTAARRPQSCSVRGLSEATWQLECADCEGRTLFFNGRGGRE